jgi:hypothetical protein
VNRPLVIIAFLAALWVPCTPLFAAPPSQAESIPKVDSTDSRAVFFQRLKSVADSGDLFAPLSAARILEIDLQLESAESIPQPADCSESWKSRSVQTTKGVAAGSSWYRVLPSGAGNMEIPAAFINPAAKSGSATVGYEMVRRVQCTDRFRLQDHSKASLSFGGLPSFACITGSDIRRLLPEARPVTASDGVSLFVYQGRLDDDVGVQVEFFFRMGVPCAIAATVRQDQQAGLRFLRADAKHRNCRVDADREFCAKRADVTWSNGAVLDEMDRHAESVCGTVDALAKQDRERGTKPRALPRVKQGVGPCQKYDD